jgi:hypothetical protein
MASVKSFNRLAVFVLLPATLRRDWRSTRRSWVRNNLVVDAPLHPFYFDQIDEIVADLLGRDAGWALAAELEAFDQVCDLQSRRLRRVVADLHLFGHALRDFAAVGKFHTATVLSV